MDKVSVLCDILRWSTRHPLQLTFLRGQPWIHQKTASTNKACACVSLFFTGARALVHS